MRAKEWLEKCREELGEFQVKRYNNVVFAIRRNSNNIMKCSNCKRNYDGSCVGWISSKNPSTCKLYVPVKDYG